MTYNEYRALTDELMVQGKTTGPNQSTDLTHYTELNIQRMKRLDKTTVLLNEWNAIFDSITEPLKWTVLAEAWCGDAAQIVPIMNKIAEASNGKISMDILLRDENLELMDQYLTNGSRGIPKLICYNANHDVLWNWGPRPKAAQDLMNELKALGKPMADIKTELHLWYTKDKTEQTQKELLAQFKA
ncbi:MAG: thioredoxin family protein [Bacteroidota bacterium]